MAESINIRMISHFLYCPHRWGLMEIDKAWAENYFVVKADLQHERVHDSKKSYTLRGKKVFTGVKIWNDDYDIFGVTDCIEVADDNVNPAELCIVEYKPTKPKDKDFHETDAIQVFAQKVCVDSVFGCKCSAVIYYADEKKRVALPFDTQYERYNKQLRDLLALMRTYTDNGIIPPIQKGQKCSGCSMKDLCIPKFKKTESVKTRIRHVIEETEDIL